MHRRSCLALLAIAAFPALPALAADAPALLLAQVYRPGLPLQDYWVSEKYDGVRGFWDGRTLRTRGGETVRAPAWFTAGWPEVTMDGATPSPPRANSSRATWPGARYASWCLTCPATKARSTNACPP